MSDMQKVRVSLTDAEGKVHEVVGYSYSGRAVNGVYALDLENSGEVCPWYIEIEETLTPFAVIQELPTGLGAVVRVQYPNTDDSDAIWVRFCGEEWISEDGAYGSDDWMKRSSFTVLSEGVK